MKRNKHTILQKIGRLFKLNFLKLLRSPGGAKKVSLGFALGFGMEMLVISTASLIYILFIPIVRLAKGSLPASIIGNVIGKLSFLPVILLPFAKKIGKMVFPLKVSHGHNAPFSFHKIMHGDFHGMITVLFGGIHVLIGMSIFGAILGVLSYFVVYHFYEKQKEKRMNKRRLKRVERGNHA